MLGFPMKYNLSGLSLAQLREQLGNAVLPGPFRKILKPCLNTLSEYLATQAHEERMEIQPLLDSFQREESRRHEREESRTLSPDPQPLPKKRKIFVDLTDD